MYSTATPTARNSPLTRNMHKPPVILPQTGTATRTAMIHHLPLCAINRDALPCDRSTLDHDALADLQTSIATTGLSQPIKVWCLSSPTNMAAKMTSTPPLIRPDLRPAPPDRPPQPRSPTRQWQFHHDPRLHPHPQNPDRSPRPDDRGKQGPRRPLSLRARPHPDHLRVRMPFRHHRSGDQGPAPQRQPRRPHPPARRGPRG